MQSKQGQNKRHIQNPYVGVLCLWNIIVKHKQSIKSVSFMMKQSNWLNSDKQPEQKKTTNSTTMSPSHIDSQAPTIWKCDAKKRPLER